MKLEECERRNKLIVQNGIEWANERECIPLEQLDVAIISEYCSLNVPKCFYNFSYSENINHVVASKCHKSIFRFLDKLRKKILKMEDIK